MNSVKGSYYIIAFDIRYTLLYVSHIHKLLQSYAVVTKVILIPTNFPEKTERSLIPSFLHSLEDDVYKALLWRRKEKNSGLTNDCVGGANTYIRHPQERRDIFL